METKFTITDAVAKYQQIAEYYRAGWTSKLQAETDIQSLNEQCEKAGIMFKSDFKSLELFIKDEESEESEWSESEWDAGDSSF